MAAYELRDVNGKVVAVSATPFTYDKEAGGWRLDSVVVPDPGRACCMCTSRISKLQFIERFTDAEAAAIYQLAATVPAVALWIKKFEAAEPESDGTGVDLASDRTIAGVYDICAALEAAGKIPVGQAAARAAAVLTLPA